jgi:hypothetical protein
MDKFANDQTKWLNNPANQFDNLVGELLQQLGFKTKKVNDKRIDYLIESENHEGWVDVKWYRSERIPNDLIRQAAYQLLADHAGPRKSAKYYQILAVSSIVASAGKARILEATGVLIWDRNDLLSLSAQNLALWEGFNSLFLLARQGIETSSTTVPLTNFNTYLANIKLHGRFGPQKKLSHDDFFRKIDQTIKLRPQQATSLDEFSAASAAYEDLLRQLRSTATGKGSWSKFEEVGEAIIKKLFPKDLPVIKRQSRTVDKLTRFDLIGRVASDDDFWRTVVSAFRSRYVVIEFKNYVKPITQKEILTTEQYLYPNALRSTAIILTRKGGNEQAHQAAIGALRAHGKLILILDDEDLKKMIAMRAEGSNPNDLLSAKLDDLLMPMSR